MGSTTNAAIPSTLILPHAPHHDKYAWIYLTKPRQTLQTDGQSEGGKCMIQPADNTHSATDRQTDRRTHTQTERECSVHRHMHFCRVSSIQRRENEGTEGGMAPQEPQTDRQTDRQRPLTSAVKRNGRRHHIHTHTHTRSQPTNAPAQNQGVKSSQSTLTNRHVAIASQLRTTTNTTHK